jgi:copper chaperone CopZ
MLYETKETNKMREFSADSLYPTSQPILSYYFEKGLLEYEENNFVDARSYIARARGSRVINISMPSNKLFAFMNHREVILRDITDKYEEVNKIKAQLENLNAPIEIIIEPNTATQLTPPNEPNNTPTETAPDSVSTEQPEIIKETEIAEESPKPPPPILPEDLEKQIEHL